jgi:subtilisin-like proprotein convertase family protein/secreted trypsin-like serine protease
MDDAGNFTIAWGSGAQDLSYFNSVRARSFDRDYGLKLAELGIAEADAKYAGPDFLVNVEDTTIHFNPYVAVSGAGDVLITWVNTNDEDYITNSGLLVSSVRAIIYGPNGNVIIPQFAPGGSGRPKAAFDKTDSRNYVITWDAVNENDNTGNASEGARGRMWELYDANGNVSGREIRSTFTVNSASYDTGRAPLWPNDQWYAHPALDADGDLTIAYHGFGPDVQDEGAFIAASYYQKALSNPANADLLPFLPTFFNTATDIDLGIELTLISAANSGATLTQLGRIRAILDEQAGLLRGEANGIMYSQYDTTANSGTILFSDSVANAKRDGHNQKYILIIDTSSTGGNFTLRMVGGHTGGFEDVQITPVYTNQNLNVGQTRTAIETALRGATRTGVNWPDNIAGYEGPVVVRTVSTGFGNISAELQARQVTLSDGSQPWAYPWGLMTLSGSAVFEITFQGEVHDTYMGLNVQANALSPTGSFVSLAEYQAADAGTKQENVSLAMEPDGDFTMVWLQTEEYTSDSDRGFGQVRGSANQNLYYRRFDESTDTAGPNVTDLVDHNGNRVDHRATIYGAVRHIVLTFDERLNSSDPEENFNSVFNLNNWILSQDGISIVGAVRHVEYGLNKASELAGTYDGVGDANGGMGNRYELSNTPTNKWEVVLTLDANGLNNAGVPALGIGEFEITALASIQDVAGNALGANGTIPSGRNVKKTFNVWVEQPDIEIDENVGSSNRSSGTLHPESPNAVAVDSDGDHVVVWTAYDSSVGHDRVYWRLFDADGSPADLPLVNSSGQVIQMLVDAAPVLPVTSGAAFQGNIQRHASVAIDPDGDFVITWTNYRNGDADIYARTFPARPVVFTEGSTGAHVPVFTDKVSDPFRVNDYTADAQKWSDVAMDAQGDFVITWSSYAQELNGNLGSGYGVYARRYDSEGRALAPEFQVNVTTAGDQQTPSVAMAADGTFVIAWTSDQNGKDDDIIVREFNRDGSPKAGPLSGERRVNDYQAGHQRYPDVAMRFDGLSYVVTWTDTAADISGTSVWAELSSPQPQRYLDPLPHAIVGTHSFTINVGDSFTIADVNVQLGALYHENLQELQVLLTHGNVTIVLFDNLPRPSLINGTRPPQTTPNMYGTIFDDEAPSSIRITDTDKGAVPPYNGTFVPQDVLAAFDGMNAQGAWTLTVIDRNPGNGLTGSMAPISEWIGSWNLDITEDTQQYPDSFLVNSTTIGHQMFSSVAMDTYGNFTVTWSGQGEPSQDTDGHGVYYQRYDRGGTRIGSQTLVNLDTQGDQWISSVGMDARGNFVIAWTGQGTLPGTTAIYKYDSIRNFPRTDNDGPIVTDVYYGNQRIFNGSVIVAESGEVTQIKVVFNEDLSVLNGKDGLNSVLNPNNWLLVRNDVEIVGGVVSVQFGLNLLTNKYEATLTLDGNGINFGTPGLERGDYVLTVRDLITDTARYIDPDDDTGALAPGNYLDGDYDGVPGSQPITLALGGYEHKFAIASGAKNGPEFRINEDATVAYEQRISQPGGIGQGQEESNRSVAVDNDGDFAVVWTTYGLDDPTDPTSGGVYLRLFDRNDKALTSEIRVNQNVVGHQRNASIAMDADGDFVVVWESEGTSLDGSWDVFARRFDSMGRALGNEFRVNSTTTANQVNPAVAMDDRGAFVVVWATSGQNFSYFNDIYAQRYDRFGAPLGTEFRVNSNDLPGATAFPPGRFEINPTVAMAGTTGDFIFAWEVVTAQQNGVATNTVIAGNLFDSSLNSTGEFRLDTGVGTGGGDQFRVARNPQLVMNDQGGYMVVWESYSGNALDGYDVYYQEFQASGATISAQVNLPLFTGHQVNPSIAADADGDFAIVWNGPGATVNPLNPTNPDQQVDFDDAGIFKLHYNAANQPVTVQERVNRTEAGVQSQATIAMEPDGDSIVVWSGVGVGDNHGIFARRYNEATDTAGPTVSDWADGRGNSLDNGHIFEGAGNEVQYLILTFDEDMLQTGADRVTNPANYALLRGGIAVPGAIVRVQYGLNLASQLAGTVDPLTGKAYDLNPNKTNKYEAILTFDGDLTTSGLQPLEDASYTVEALAAVPGFRSGLRDAVGNTLYRTGLLPTGRNFSASFVVQIEEPPPTPDPDPPAVTGNAQAKPVDLDAILVNQRYSEAQYTTAGQSLAVDNDGDFVVVWTRYDAVDTNGKPTDANIYARYFTDEVQRLTLPAQMAEDTDDVESTVGTFTLAYAAPEIQMLSITAGIKPFTTDDPNSTVDKDEVGRITGSFVLGYDLTGDGTIGDDPGVNETVAIRSFAENTMEANAAAIQSALRSLGGPLAGVTVSAVNPRDYLIKFADGTAGLNVSEITVQSIQLVQAYLPAVTVSTLREGMVFQGIRVSQDNPMETAANIANAIKGATQTYGAVGPVDSTTPARAASATSSSIEAPYEQPWWISSYGLEVEVAPVVTADGTLSLTEFDITFVGSSGKQDHPQLVVSNARNDRGQTVSIPSSAITTRKEPSNEFRVNPEEGTVAYNQTNPAVAMDADGDFVIVWESEVPNSVKSGSVSDIFARRYSPYGKTAANIPGAVTDIYGGSAGVRTLINAEAEEVQRLIFDANDPFSTLTGTFRLRLGTVLTEPIAFNSANLRATGDNIVAKLAAAGVKGVTVVQVPTATTGRYRLEVRFGGESAGIDHPALEYVADVTPLAATVTTQGMPGDMYTIAVNQGTSNPQFDPAVAMDESGGFVVAWANGGQLLSYFNHISVQRFNRDGERVGNEFQVNAETTDIQFSPYVALSNSGNYLITWSSTPDVGYALGQNYVAGVRAKVFDSTGNQLVGEFTVGTGGTSAAAFDADDNYVITWQGLFDTDAGVVNLGVHARQFALYDNAGQPNTTPAEIRSEFRINSSTTTLGDPTLWPYDQLRAQPAIDADGDLSIIYEGFGPDVSVNVSMAAGYFSQLMSQAKNRDLWVYFDPFNVYERGQEGVPVAMISQFLGNNGDVDGSIDQVLFRATQLGATDPQLGRLRAILEATVGQLRGEANGILLSQWDANPTLSSVLSPLYSDSVVNSYRDGQNQRSYLEIPMQFSVSDARWYQAERGTFTVQVTNLLTGAIQTAVVDIASNGMGQPLNIEGTRQNLEAALEGMAILGSAWASDEGTIDIREVEPDEIIDRSASDWDIDRINETQYDEVNGGVFLVNGFRNILYEIVFQGSAHDTPFKIDVIASATERGGFGVDAQGNVSITWVPGPPAGPAFFGDTYGIAGTQQTMASIGMEPDGDFVTVYTQIENYRNAGFVSNGSGTANSNIYFRRFEEKTDTAGPRVTDWADSTGKSLADNAVLQSNLQYVVVTFDENMLSGDPAANADSILNTANFILSANGVRVAGGVINVAFGLSKAAELAGQVDPLTGELYGLDAIPSNKWEAVITLDGDLDMEGAQPLRDGTYSFEALASVSGSSTIPGHSGLRDVAGNTLYHTGYTPGGADFVRSFTIQTTSRQDKPVTDTSTTGTLLSNGHTDVESPGAIAADADGQYVVVWTATDAAQGNLAKIFYRLYDADGTPADLPIVDNQTGQPILGAGGQPILVRDAFPILPVTPSSSVLAGFEQFAQDTQSNATVAIDADGDFVVTWTNFRAGNADIYARRFDSMGEVAGLDEIGRIVFKGGSNSVQAVTDAFRVNNYTANSQKWSNVAMDVDGDFVITWSSYGQEDNGQLGLGYGVYARRYDSFGQPLGTEFLVNVTKAGNQRFSTVAMDAEGGFTIAWTSNQNGISDDIIVRDFYSDGTPVGGPLGGEIVANQTLTGDQRYPDISMNLAGDQYVVTWSSSGQDGSGWGVYGRLFNRSNTTLYVPSSPSLVIPDTGTVEATLNVSNNAIITDVNVQLELSHKYPSDLTATLISPSGTSVVLFDRVPRTRPNGTLPSGSDFSGTLFDDAAAVAITDPVNGAVPPFAGTFQPEGALAAFNGENVNGQWRLQITDSNGNDRSGLLEQWTLIVERSAVPETEFRVNTTSSGNQMYSSVAMDHQGEFVVTWSGFGNQPEHEDLSGSGVFLQRFEATGDRISTESRVNMTTEGDQAIPSVSSDGIGNFYIAYTGVRRDSLGNNIPGQTDVYVLASKSTLILRDNDPPIVTDVRLSDGTRLLEGDVIPSTTGRLLVLFSESMSLSGMSSVENVSNWVLERNGGAISGAIESVDFRYNVTTRKYEAELTLAPSVLPLSAGQYVITASSVITDNNRNALDGDRDGIPGSNPTTTTQPGYQFSFNVSNSPSGASVGAEYRVNSSTIYQDQFSASYGTGTARETSSVTLAVDHDGDYAAVWIRYGADDPTDSTGAGVYMRLYDRNDKPLTGEILVNTKKIGNQTNPSVAMDADGDLVVVWQSENSSVDGSYDVYARRFSSVGTPLDDAEFRVNRTTQLDQVNPAVAMDNSGNFVVVWATRGESIGFSNNIYGQLYNRQGQALGNEFRIDSQGLPGITPPADGSFVINPSVGMSGLTGSFVVAWEVTTAQQNGIVTDTVIAARQFDASGNPLAVEFAADTGVGTGGSATERVARNPQVAVDDRGGFIVVWESYTGADYDVFFQQFDAAGAALSDGQVNMAQFAGQQVNPSVSIDADGDFAIVFNGAGAQPDPLNPNNPALYTNEDPEGVWLRRYNSTSIPVSVQSRVNITQGGVQNFPTIGMEPDGDFVVAWSGRGVGDHQGIFVRRYKQTADTAGPIVSDLVAPTGQSISSGDQITGPITQLVVVFDEEMSTTGVSSVTRPANYRLVHDGTLLSNVITNITFGLNPATNKWEAVLTLDGNGSAAGIEPLKDGQYVLTVLNTVTDKVGNPLGATGWNPKGSSMSWTFNLLNVSTATGQGEDLISQGLGAEFTRPFATQAVASDADGDTVTVWTSDVAGREGIYARVTQVTWTASGVNRVSSFVDLPVILVTSNPTADFASVAMDGDGDFVVTWSQLSPTTSWDVYARRFDSMGNPLGDAFRVNSETDDVQRYSSVAMDIDGDFVITWQSNGQDESGYGIYAQRFNAEGEFIGGTGEIQVITFAGNPRGTFKLRFDGKTTEAITYSGNPFAIAATVEARLRAVGANVEVVAINLTSLGIRFLGREGLEDQEQILVVNSVITGDTGARITASTQSEGHTGEFRVNDTTENNQVYPNVAMDSGGTFVITWTSFGQDGDAANESNIYAKQFVSNAAFLNKNGGLGRVEYDWDGLSQRFPETQRIVTADAPNNHIVSTSTGYDGVVQVYDPLLGPIQGAFGTGSLLYTGRHVLTAAHVVDDGTGAPVASIQVGFDLAGAGRVSLTATEIIIHPNWNGDIFAGNDIAIIVLPETAPLEANRYDIYRGAGELGKETTLVGYGNTGLGFEDPALFDGLKRIAYNTFDAYGEALNGKSPVDFYLGPGTFNMPQGSVLLLDFDNGLTANDALGRAAGRWHLGLGLREGTAARGDSGGPSFLNGVITGVVSGGIEYAPADVDGIAGNISYGDIAWYTRVSAFAEWIDQIAQSTSSEFLVNANVLDPITGDLLVDNQTNDQMWSTVALDANGDFVITWTSVAPDLAGTGSGVGTQDVDGVYARRFDSTTNPLSEVFQVNTTTSGEQQHSRVAMDADGDFVIAWESNTPAGFDILAQRYVSSAKLALANATAYGANGAVGGEFTVNTTRQGDQRYPGIAMDDTGDYVIVWSGNGNQPGEVSTQGVFAQRLQLRKDDAGPTVTGLHAMIVSGSGAEMARLIDGTTFDESVGAIAINFGESLSTFRGDAGRESVLNLNNWELTRDGELVPFGVWQIQFVLNNSTHKYEAVLLLDDDPDKAGAQPLARGDYVLTLRDAVEDLFDNRLDGNYDGTPGGSFTVRFTVASKSGPLPDPGTPDPDDSDKVVNVTTLEDQYEPAVARAPDGRYVVVWTSLNDPLLDAAGAPIEDALGEPIVYTNVYARQFDRYGKPLSGEILVTSYTAGNQGNPDVAIDEYGNFVVVWQGEGDAGNGKFDSNGIFGRVFDAHGQPSGDQFGVNDTRDGDQTDPAVAMNGRGEFVVTWLSQKQGGIMARQFALNGKPTSSEFRVNSTTGNSHASPDVAIDSDGDYAITWAAAEQDNGSMGVFAQRFSASGSRLGSTFMVNQYQTDKQEKPRIAMDDAGNFVIAWQSFGQDAFGGYGVYARRYGSTGAALSNEFRVNEFTAGYQFEPAVSMDSNGDFVITWSSFNQEGDQGELYGIFAKMYNADGSLFVLSGQTAPLGEFRVNALIAGDQRASDVSMDADGHYVVVWQGTSDSGFVEDPDNAAILIPVDGLDIYARVVDPPLAAADDGSVLTLYGTPGQDTFEFIAGTTPSTWVVKVNGVAQTVASTVRTINFDGMGGNDTALLTGTSGVEKVYARPGEVRFEGTSFTVNVSDVENVTVDGKGGVDVAELRDSAGSDSLVMEVGKTVMSGPGYSNTVLKFEQVYAYAINGGVDEAKLYDTKGNEKFTGTPEYVRMDGDGFMHRAKGFRYAYGYSSGGADVAELHDSKGDDKFKHQSGLSKMFGPGFFVRAKNFPTVNAIADGGGNDYARIFDTSSVDNFVGTPTMARMYSTQANYDVTAHLFEKVLAYSTAGGNDIAQFFDSAKKEVFWGMKNKAEFSGANFEITARKFEKVQATSTPGSGDIAKLRDTEGNDHLVVDANSAKMYAVKGEEMELLYEAFAFDQVKTYRTSGTDTKNVAGTVDFLFLDDGWING